jgi:hypothetical protein
VTRARRECRFARDDRQRSLANAALDSLDGERIGVE